MIENFSFAFHAVMPLVLMIALGYLLRAKNFLPRAFFTGGNKLMFKVLLPCSLFCNIYSIESLSHVCWDIIIFAYIGTLVIFFLGYFSTKFCVRDKLSRGSALQCTFRSNIALIGLPLAISLGGAKAAAVMSLVTGFSVPLFNVLAVISLTTGETQAGKWHLKTTILGIAKNPLIIGSMLGILALCIRALIPAGTDGIPVFSLSADLPSLYTTLQKLGSLASPLSMVVLGALLDFSKISGKIKYILFGCVWRLILAPVLGISASMLLSHLGVITCGSAEYASLLPFFGSPVAASSAVMAAEMGADGELARQYVVWTSVGLILTLPLWIMIMRSFGLL